MKILVVGGGGREHALAWALARDNDAHEILCAPGNVGIAQAARCIPVAADDVAGQVELARRESVDLVVVGPEQPLILGLVDALEAEGIAAFGPSAAAARLEGSKAFAKEIMAQAGIPTAHGVDCQTLEAAHAAIDRFDRAGQQVVVKADGLAAGKGVVVTSTAQEAIEAANQAMRDRVFGDAGDRLVIEERLNGEEASILALVDGENYICLAPSQDHKPVGDGDTGPNTGGMGAYAPAPVVTAKLARRIEQDIVQPAIHAMARRGTPYKGVLYAGLIIRDGEPFVIEFNCRFGDPETQVVLPMLEGDLPALLLAARNGTLDQCQARVRRGAATCVVMAAGGYPGAYEKGHEIHGLEQAAQSPDAVVFHAGASEHEGRIVTNGGRVLGVTATGKNIKQSIEQAYRAVDCISFKDAYHRRDIGHRALARG